MNEYSFANFLYQTSKTNDKLLHRIWSIMHDIYFLAKSDKKTRTTLDISSDVFLSNHKKEIMDYLIKLGFDVDIKEYDYKTYLEISWQKPLQKEISITNIINLYQYSLQKQIYHTITPLTYTENIDNYYTISLKLPEDINKNNIMQMINSEITLFEDFIRKDVVKCLKEYHVDLGNVFISIEKESNIIEHDFFGFNKEEQINNIYVKISVYPFNKSVRLLTTELQQQESVLSKLKRALSLKR